LRKRLSRKGSIEWLIVNGQLLIVNAQVKDGSEKMSFSATNDHPSTTNHQLSTKIKLPQLSPRQSI
jgi:hypothetical protein